MHNFGLFSFRDLGLHRFWMTSVDQPAHDSKHIKADHFWPTIEWRFDGRPIVARELLHTLSTRAVVGLEAILSAYEQQRLARLRVPDSNIFVSGLLIHSAVTFKFKPLYTCDY